MSSTSKVVVSKILSIEKFKQTARDAAYLILDIVPITRKMHRTYGHFHTYIRSVRKGKVKSEDFADVDSNELRRMLDMYQQVRGPLTGFDMRWFYWMYAGMIGYLVWTFLTLYSKQGATFDQESSLDERRRAFAKDYEEDLRRQAQKGEGIISDSARMRKMASPIQL